MAQCHRSSCSEDRSKSASHPPDVIFAKNRNLRFWDKLKLTTADFLLELNDASFDVVTSKSLVVIVVCEHRICKVMHQSSTDATY